MADEHTSTQVWLYRIAQFVGIAVLALGGLYYLSKGLPTFNETRDEREAEALALVQSHPAIGASTILEAMQEHVRSMKEREQGVRLGAWRVHHVENDIYEIRVQLRDQSVRGQWFEREFIWRAHLGLKKVNAASLPADGVTPKAPDQEPQAAPQVN
ncbi:MAG: hypothetical protein OEY28_13175 [Nitrospira sp.]|nr:hypothetical protein [Nitrospira sp.]